MKVYGTYYFVYRNCHHNKLSFTFVINQYFIENLKNFLTKNKSYTFDFTIYSVGVHS